MAWVEEADAVLRGASRTLEPTVVSMLREVDLPTATVLAESTPPLGIYGVGVWRDDGGVWRPAITVVPGLAGLVDAEDGPTVLTLTDVPDRLRGLTRALAEDRSDVVVVIIEPPDEQFARVKGALNGTLGTPVNLRDGRPGFLTAGHVGRPQGATVQIDGAVNAEIVFSEYRQQFRHPQTCADVAAIAWPDVSHLAVPSVTGCGDAAELAEVHALTASGPSIDGVVRLAHPRFAVDDAGAWADILLVDRPISVGGDSGSMVVNAADEVVGQIVGGKKGAYSVVQDIDLLLSRTNTMFRTT